MRVLCEASVLGAGHVYQRARAGVFHVAEQIVDGLLQRSDVELLLTCEQGPAPPAVLELYLASRGPDHLARLAGGARLPAFLRQLVGRPGLAARVRRHPELMRWIARIARSRKSRLGAHPHRPSRSVDVQHALAYGIPPGASGARVRFLTVYDAIPLRMPELFEPGFAALYRRQLATLGPEDRVITISECTRSDLCELLDLAPERVYVMPLAASSHLRPVEDAERIAAVRARYRVPEGRYLLSVSTLEPRKNLAHLVRCFTRIAASPACEGVQLVLAGERGWLDAELARALEASGPARRRIVFTGYVADADLPALYSGAEAFVYPSLYEGFGLPALEAMQCGVPVITSDTSALPEVVGDAGILVDPGDAEALGTSIEAVLDDPALRARRSRASLARASRFSWAASIDRLVEIYSDALARGDGR